MTNETFKDIEKLESDLWEAADNLRANSKLTSSDYFMPVLGVIFLRHAANRFDAAHRQIEADQASGKMPKRKVLPADYIARRSLYLPEKARYDWIMQQAAVSGADLPKLVTEAMTAIEAEFEPLAGRPAEGLRHLRDQGARRPDAPVQQRADQAGHRRRLRPHLRVLPRQVLDPEGARQRRVLHAVLDRADHRQRHRARPRHGVRPGLRLGRHVRAVEPLHRARGRRHGEEGRLLRPGEEPRHHPHRQDEPRGARAGGEDRRGHHLLPGRAHPRRQVRLRDGQSALQRGPGRRRAHQGRPAPALRPAGREQAEEGRQRQLPLDLLLLELPEREGPRRLRHVLAGLAAPGTARRRCAGRSSRPATWT